MAVDADKVRKQIAVVRSKARLSGDRDHMEIADTCEKMLADGHLLRARVAELELNVLALTAGAEEEGAEMRWRLERIAELEAALSSFREAWESATSSGHDGLSVSCDNLDAASQLAAELLAKKGE